MVVANAAEARLLEETDEPGAYTHIADLVHPASRMKGVELGHDRAGHVEGVGHGLGSAAYERRTDVRTREREHFAAEVARYLDDGVASQRCGGLVIVASNPFLGELNAHLGKAARRILLREVPADYTALSERELAQKLAALALKELR